MNKFSSILNISFISSIIAIISNCLGRNHASYIILLSLIIIDTLTGATVAVKYNRFGSKGFSKLVKKIITYATAILSVRLLEIGISSLVTTNIISQIAIIFLEITETISILENLTMLGVPLPASFIPFLLKHLKIPGIDAALSSKKNKESNIDEIEDMIKYHIPSFNDENLRLLLEIKFKSWKSLAYQINKIFKEINTTDNDHIYYKVMSLIKLEFKDMKLKWKEAGIPKEYIENFMSIHEPKISNWLEKIKNICYSNKPNDKKQSEIIDSIIVILYQTILDAHKMNC
ncbi:phage holin family protein [Caldisalinibacter kiritimatiensis]|uniref:Holin n=1 Tax=Caldisalinibacter kiritimatiensis TaxID=1304284 RepID=R1CDZ6_9FIRM|nr:phage holin family protein [Caldisalinibacter kiritimatiensis]EOD00485.1 hypothetical protein L21TH_1464 [Caldisalinibacter kiritimatiensis]